MGPLSVIAVIAVLAGGAQTAVVMSQDNQQAAGANKEPVVQVQAIQQDDHKPAATREH